MIKNMMFIDSAAWNFSLENFGPVWKNLVQIGLLLIALLLGYLLSRVIPFIKKSFIPSALLGGAILLAVHYIVKAATPNHYELIDKSFMQVVTYHGLGIGFVAMTLKTNKEKKKTTGLKVLQNGAMTGGTYMLQAFLGLAITLILCKLTQSAETQTFYASGVILPLGFGQGPGNALAWDINYTNDYGALFQGNGSFGLTIASVGFIVSAFVGVIYINVFKRRKEIPDREQIIGKRDSEVFESSNEMTDNESCDKMTVQIGLVALGYALSFGIMAGLGAISNFTNQLAWGFNFIWGVLAATIIKLLFKAFKKKGHMKREYINNYQMDRISGFAFDIMIVAGVAAIDIENVRKYALPLILLCVIGTCATYFYVRFITKRVFKGYHHEMFLANFGMLTGTASNGMILLKEVDPNFETPVANLLVLAQLSGTLFVAPLLLLLNFTAKSVNNSIIAMIIYFALFIAYTAFLLISNKKAKLKESN